LQGLPYPLKEFAPPGVAIASDIVSQFVFVDFAVDKIKSEKKNE